MHPWVNHYYNIYNKKLNREYGHIAKWNFISDSSGTVLYIGAATGFTAWVRQVTGLLQRVWKVNGDLSCVRTFLDTDSCEEEQGQSIPSGGWVCAADVLKQRRVIRVRSSLIVSKLLRYPNITEKDTQKNCPQDHGGEKIADSWYERRRKEYTD